MCASPGHRDRWPGAGRGEEEPSRGLRGTPALRLPGGARQASEAVRRSVGVVQSAACGTVLRQPRDTNTRADAPVLPHTGPPGDFTRPPGPAPAGRVTLCAWYTSGNRRCIRRQTPGLCACPDLLPRGLGGWTRGCHWPTVAFGQKHSIC